jgi:hypothetical protein
MPNEDTTTNAAVESVAVEKSNMSVAQFAERRLNQLSEARNSVRKPEKKEPVSEPEPKEPEAA